MLSIGLFMEPLNKIQAWAWRPAGGLLLLALGALTWGLWRGGSTSLWFDEALTVSDAWHPRGVNHNPMFYGLIRVCADSWGGLIDERGLRLLSAICALLSIPLCYLSLLPLAGERRSSWASLMLALSPWALYWATNARPYAPGLLVILLGNTLMLRALVRDAPRGAALGLVIMGLAGSLQLSMLVAPLALVVAILLGPAFGLDPAPRVRRMCFWAAPIVLLLGGLLFSGDLMVYLAQKAEIKGLSGLKHFALAAGFALTPILGLCALWGTWRARQEGQGLVCLLALAALLGALAVAGVGWFGQSTAQYAFCLLPWALLLAVWPLGERGGWIYGGVLVLPLVLLSGFELGPWHGSRPRWREAFAYVQAQRGPEDLVLSMQAGLGDLYTHPGWTDARYPVSHAWADRTQPMRLVDAARSDRPSWLILRRDFLLKWPDRWRSALERILDQQAECVQVFENLPLGRNMTLEVYRLFPLEERGAPARIPF